MHSRYKTGVGITFLIIGLILGLAISSNFNLQTTGNSLEPNISQEAIDILSRSSRALAEVTAAVKPAVVNISTSKTIKSQGAPHPFFNDPFFKRFFGDDFGPTQKPKDRKQSNLGSGVIVDKNGYILTNNHVIKDADDIRIRLSDKREFKGKVIGTDPKSDIAVVKIEAQNLPVLRLADSDLLQVGETVIAIGNPFGLNATVTSGIVSAVGRSNVGISDYEDFIQTDAAINPGNSGGALISVRGELVGVNTAIFSTSGGYQGVGFAIPSNLAKSVMDSLITKGKVVRGWLGVSIQPVSAEIAKQFNLKDEKGALVGDVTDGSPAEKAGLRRGDVITDFNGKEVADPSSLRNAVASTSPGKDVTVKYIRDGKAQSTTVRIAELPSDLQARSAGKSTGGLKGVSVQNITPEIRRSLDLPKRVQGVIVTDVEDGTPADDVLARGDVIMQVNRIDIKNAKEYEAAAAKGKGKQGTLLVVYRNGSSMFLMVPEK
ncbi:MAG TPA: DegQ family serine endoprotease [Dissulfurispiraceae bacterium]|nr:DegQ family serine endoprotease [Dissulfurispiraceae bacterium]